MNAVILNHPFRKAIVRVVLPYVLLAGLWVLGSGRLLEVLLPDPAARAQGSLYTGWALVLATALLLCFLLRAGLGARETRTAALAEDDAPAPPNMTERKRVESLLTGQKQVLEMVASGAPLPEALVALVSLLEGQAPGMLGSVLLLDEDGVHLRHGAAPSLPAEWIAAVDGVSIGPCVGSCGTAAYRQEAVFVEDIATDPLWAAYKAAALPHGLRACWSTPIFDAQRRVIGTFAMYYRQPRLPLPEHRRLIDAATHTAAIAISHHRTEAALRAKTDELDRYFTHSLDLLCILYTEGSFRRLNPEWESALGYRLAELEGQRFLNFVHPEDVPATRAALAKLSSQEHVLDFVNRYRHKDGSYRWIEWRCYAAGSLIYAVARNITARKAAEAALRESEEQFREAFYRASVGKAQAEPVTGRFLRVNPAFCAFTRYTEAELLEKTFDEITLPEDREGQAGFYARLLRREIPAFTREKRYLRKDGTVVWGSVSVTLLFDDDGRASLATAVIQDITERKQAEVKARVQLAELQQWYDLMLGREERVRELKREVNELLRQTGQHLRYPGEETEQ